MYICEQVYLWAVAVDLAGMVPDYLSNDRHVSINKGHLRIWLLATIVS